MRTDRAGCGALEQVEVGFVVAQGCHAPLWIPTMNPQPGQGRTTGMVVTKIWSYRRAFAEDLARRFPGVQVVAELEDMVGTVDGVYIDAAPAVSLYHLLARPFLQAGVPTFINRPFCTSVEKGRLMVEMAKQSGAPLMSNSTWEFTESVGELQEKIGRLPEILGYTAHNTMSDYYTHGLHGVWYLAAALRAERQKGRGRCLAASYLTPDWRTPPGAVSFVHENPGGKRFYGQLHLQSGMDGLAYMRVLGSAQSGDVESRISAHPGWFRHSLWNTMQLVVQEMIQTRRAPESGEHILEKVGMFLMGFRSALEREGGLVTREELEGWEAPPISLALKKGDQPTDPTFGDPYSPEELRGLESYLS
ncbi:MAG: Gfo/Idh/MocA family oxidoreductase [Candidatus Latescibacteria bacterium]|nr:Gfo/Idh/MocA family oxidoreductase [Candidatus Latescibacterota bacterium]